MADDAESLCEVIRSHSAPLEPLPTDMAADRRPLSGILAVLFDVYGTLFISGSGELGMAREAARPLAAADALIASGVEPLIDAVELGGVALERFFSDIERRHREARSRGVQFPEVLIEEVWRSVVDQLKAEQLIRTAGNGADIARRFSVESECRQNLTWPMPGLERVLGELYRSGRKMGIVSNAQFFTPLLFEAHARKTPVELGFEASLTFYSYEHGAAKPGKKLFELAREQLEALGLGSEKALYVGNDVLNDIRPAQEVGFRTCLFAGDRRSLRLREGEVTGVYPDRVVTALDQLLSVIEA